MSVMKMVDGSGRSMKMVDGSCRSMKMVDGSGRSRKMVDGVVSMGMMSIVKMVVPCHSFVRVSVLFCFLDF